MSNRKRSWRAIDLYSGIGGWSLGLKMAGIEIVASYEWWGAANETNRRNNHHEAVEGDIRNLSLESLPKNIDIVVGSPPCTQFSYANRGGRGDIADGLRDIYKFLAVVNHVKPKFWAMENVPRVAKIFRHEMKPGGVLERYAHLDPAIEVVDMSEWGLPQRRQRCIIGNFDAELLKSYREHTLQKTLGDVVEALTHPRKIKDPIYGISVSVNKLFDHVIEAVLSPEEERMNREQKTFHPVYNGMAFPDPLDRTARTVTATCTRVSRESIIVPDANCRQSVRRLSVRERGSLQGFPITFQFYGNTYSQKLKMIGNAVPPLFTFYLAQSMLGVKSAYLARPDDGIVNFVAPVEMPSVTVPDSPGNSFPGDRKFRAAIPHLHFKSGTRFELVNVFTEDKVSWAVRFYFGDSKNIAEIPLGPKLLTKLQKLRPRLGVLSRLEESLSKLQIQVKSTCSKCLQETWNRSRLHKVDPYTIVDALGNTSREIIQTLKSEEIDSDRILTSLILDQPDVLGAKKLLRHSTAVLAGLVVGSFANGLFTAEQLETQIAMGRRK